MTVPGFAVLCNLLNTNTHRHTHTKNRRENGDGVARGAVRDNERCNDSVEEVDEIEEVVASESVTIACPLCRGVLEIVVAVLTTDPP